MNMFSSSNGLVSSSIAIKTCFLTSCKSNFCIFSLQGHASAFYTLEEGLWGTRGNGKSNSENRAGDSQAILNDILLTTLDT